MEGLKNYMEDVVQNHLDSILAQCPDICQCEKCKRDIVAIALNHLPPYYVSSEEGSVMVKANLMTKQFDTDVIAAIVNGISLVRKEVRHGK